MIDIVKIKFGSHLYGTSTKDSDTDYKGIFLPDIKDVVLNKIPKSLTSDTKKNSDTKNSPDDIDTEIYSLQYFIKLACEGQTVALDMLHAPENMIVEGSGIWDEIVKNKEQFYTKNLKAFVGYARRQASKYGIKGSRLADAKKVLDFLSEVRDGRKLQDIWDVLPEGEHIFKHLADVNGIRNYEVCGRKTGETARADYLYGVVLQFYKNYGERAKQAANNEGIDWKAISHAFRAGYEVKEILTEKSITFPLKEAAFLIGVKTGEFDYQTVVAPKLDSLMDEIEELAKNSDLPDKVNVKYWEDFIYAVYQRTWEFT